MRAIKEKKHTLHYISGPLKGRTMSATVRIGKKAGERCFFSSFFPLFTPHATSFYRLTPQSFSSCNQRLIKTPFLPCILYSLVKFPGPLSPQGVGEWSGTMHRARLCTTVKGCAQLCKLVVHRQAPPSSHPGPFDTLWPPLPPPPPAQQQVTQIILNDSFRPLRPPPSLLLANVKSQREVKKKKGGAGEQREVLINSSIISPLDRV